VGQVDRAVTVKSSISLSDDQHAFARALVDSGRFPSVSAVLQQGLDLLRQQDADAQVDRAALRSLLAERATGPFVSAGELRKRLAKRRA
jgi:antitoxin ParD1/3/4